MGTSVGCPGVPLKILVIWVMHSSPLFVTPHHHPALEIHSASSAAVPLGQRSTPSRLALHPHTGHIWSPGSTHNTSNKPAAALHSVTPAKHVTGVRASPRAPGTRGHSMLSKQPLSGLGVKGQHPHLVLPPGRGSDAGSQKRLLQINPLTNPVSMLFIPSE